MPHRSLGAGPLNILVIEDSEMDFHLIKRELDRAFPIGFIKRVDQLLHLEEQLREREWSVVISDYNIPGLGVGDSLATIRHFGEPPVILISGAIGEEATVEMLRAGVSDVVLKSNLPRLSLALKRILKERAILEREKLAREAERKALLARQEMLAIVSHDLRNPLAAVQLNAERLLNRLETEGAINPEEDTRQLRSIIRSTVRMKILIADVLDNVRFEVGSFVIHKSRRSLSSFMTEVFEVFDGLCREKSVNLIVQNESERVVAELDYERIFQVLSNLLSNGIKFTPSGGVITLSTTVRGDEVEFQVRDSGPGLAQDQLDKVFGAYYQGSQSAHLGVGLGLKIAKDIVEAHGGHIYVESELGRGALFGVRIPCDWTVRENLLPGNIGLAKRPVWLVDDDEDLREILAANLRDLDLDVREMSSGTELVDAFSESAVAPDLLIVDYRLGDMTGGEALQKISAKGDAICPVIILSAETNVSQLAEKYRASAYLTKPIRLNDLILATRRLLLN